MPHQQELVDVFLEVQSEAAGDEAPGEWAYDDGTATMQRRAGKTTVISPIVAHRARLVKRAQMFMTAQTRDKAKRRWMDVTEDLLGSVLRGDVARKVSIGHEELRWRQGGAALTPFAPNEDGLHSETPDFVVVDELWAFNAEQERAIKAGYVPAFATSSGQALKMSTMGTEASVWLNKARDAGRSAVSRGVTRGVFYLEHSLPDSVDGVPLRKLADEAVVEACIAWHPAICHVPGCSGPRLKQPCLHGFTVRPAALWSAWTEMDNRAEFIRAYGNRTAEDIASRWQGIDESAWTAGNDLAGQGIPARERVALGVWVDDQGLDAAVSAGWRGGDGVMRVEHVKRSEGIRWVVEYAAQVAGRQEPLTVAIRSTGPSRDVADELKAAGVPVLLVSVADEVAAVSRHRSELEAGTWRHLANDEATDAAAAVDIRKAGRGVTWERVGDSIAAVGAQTLAGWGFDHAPQVEVMPPFWMG